MATYHMRADGTAANKGAADGTGDASTFMDCETHNGESFAGLDVIVLHDGAGKFTDAILQPPTGGTLGNVITYQAASGETPILSAFDVRSSWSKTGGQTNVYETPGTITVDAQWCLEDDVPLTEVASIAACDSAAGSFYMDGAADILYVHASDGGDPSSNGSVYESTQRDRAMHGQNRAYVTYDGLQFDGGSSNVIDMSNGAGNETFQNCTIQYGVVQGIRFSDGGTSSGFTADNCTYNYCADGQYLRSDDATVKNCTFYRCGRGIELRDVDNQHCQNFLIENNTFIECGFDTYGVAQAAHGNAGILLDGDTNGDNADYHTGIIRYNWFEKSNGRAIDGFFGECQIYYNIIIDTRNSTSPEDGAGIGIEVNGPDNDVYNNVIYDAQNIGIMLNTDPIAPNVASRVKNNIVMGATYSTQHYAWVSASRGVTDVWSNNCYYDDSAAVDFYFEGTAGRTFAQWVSDTGSADEIESDPLFVDAASGNFRLQAGSPCIEAGADLNLTQDYYGNTPDDATPDVGAVERQAVISYMRSDGTATIPELATSPAAASTSMSVSTYNSSNFEPGDVIVLSDQGGVYRMGSERILCPSSGSDGSPITHQAETGETPVLSGSLLIGTWGLDSGSIWSATVTTDPVNGVYFDGTRGTKQASKAACTSAGDWFWETNVLYIYSAGGDPDTEFTSPGIEACRRNDPIHLNSKNYLTFDGLTIQHGRENNSAGTVHSAGTNIIFQNCTFDNNDGLAHIEFGAGSSNCLVDNCTITNGSWANGAAEVPHGVYLNGSTGTNTVSDCAINNVQGAGIKNVNTPTDTYSGNTIHTCGASGITLNQSSVVNCVIENNTVYSCQQITGDRYNIDLFLVGAGNIVRYNVTHDCNYVSFDAGGIRFDGDTSAYDMTGNKAYYNICYNERVGIESWNGTDVEIYNNTIYNSGINGIKIHFAHDCIVKNNIVHTSGTSHIHDDESNTPTVNYNLYYPDTSTPFNLDGTSYNFADWKTNSGHDAASPTPADPLFVDAANADFQFKASSNLLDAGTDVGLTQDYAQKTVGASPDIGAFEGAETYFMRGDGTATKVAAIGPASDATACMNIATHNAASYNAGATINLSDQGGEYTDDILVTQSSGSSGNPIIYQAVSGETPVINGADVRTTWGLESGTVYSATVTTEPNVVVYDDVLLTPNPGATTGVGSNEWDWDSNTLYVDVGEDPDTGTLESGQRTRCITISQTYITVDGITCKNSNGAAAGQIKAGNTVTGVTIQNCTIFNSASDGILIDGSTAANSFTLDGNTCYDNGLNGIQVYIGSGAFTDGEIMNNTCYTNGRNVTQLTADASGILGWFDNIDVHHNTCYNNTPVARAGREQNSHGIYHSGRSNGTAVIYNNTLYGQQNGAGLKLVGTATAYNNEIYDNDSYGVFLGPNSLSINVVYNLYYNLIYGNGGGTQDGGGIGIFDDGGGTWDVSIQNCSIYNNGSSSRAPIELGGGAGAIESLTLRNNILYAVASGRTLYLGATPVSLTCDYNCHYRGDGTALIYYSGSERNWAYWTGTLGFDTNGLNEDPKFVNAGGGNFRLQSTSPCIDAGVDVGLTTDYDGNTVPQ